MTSRLLRAVLASVSVAALCAWSFPASWAQAPAASPGLALSGDPTPEVPLPDYPAVAPLTATMLGEDLIRAAVPPPEDLPLPEGLPPPENLPAVEIAADPAPPPGAAAAVATAGATGGDAATTLPPAAMPLRGALDPAPPAPPVREAEIAVPLPAYPGPVPDVPGRAAEAPAAATADLGTVLPLPAYPGPVVDIAPAPVVVALRDLATTGPLALPNGLVVSKRDREAIVAYYTARSFEPLWLKDRTLTAAAHAVARQVQSADLDGLDPEAYPVLLPSAQAQPAVLAQAELALSAAAFAYARDARGGRLEPSRLSSMLTPDLDLPQPEEVLTALAAAPDPAAVLAGYQPTHPGYVALRRKLHDLRETTAAVAPRPSLGDGPALTLGMDDPRVPGLRERLGLPAAPGQTYDATLADAVRAFQRERRLPATGRLDPRTVSALQGDRPAGSFVAADVVANMERWRWLPRDLGERHIFVNLPEFTLRLVEGGRTLHTARVIVGKTETPTPVFSHAMDHVIVNPYWHIPPSILRKEVLPGLAADPDWAAKRGYEVIRRGKSISVRQPPGERNALGFIKFMFPNQHAVYLHDTPSRSLFARQQRAFSHGCVRVDQPFRLAEFVLGEQGFTEERMRAMIGKGERTIRLKTPLPVHLAYFTVTVDEAGRLQRVGDLYGHDGRIKTALGLGADGRRFAQVQRSRAQ